MFDDQPGTSLGDGIEFAGQNAWPVQIRTGSRRATQGVHSVPTSSGATMIG
jgi:hypothetical protein